MWCTGLKSPEGQRHQLMPASPHQPAGGWPAVAGRWAAAARAPSTLAVRALGRARSAPVTCPAARAPAALAALAWERGPATSATGPALLAAAWKGGVQPHNLPCTCRLRLSITQYLHSCPTAVQKTSTGPCSTRLLAPPHLWLRAAACKACAGCAGRAGRRLPVAACCCCPGHIVATSSPPLARRSQQLRPACRRTTPLGARAARVPASV